MIELYSSATPNGQKIHIMVAETGLAYRIHWVSIAKGEQFEPGFLKISPNNKIPAIVDRDGPDGAPISVFESGAILLYLAEKTGRFLPTEPRARTAVYEWLMFQMGGVGPMLGQAHHFRAYARVADMAVFPWIRLHGRQGQDLARHGNLARWFDAIAARPAVAKDMERLKDEVGEIDDEMWDNLWGRTQFAPR